MTTITKRFLGIFVNPIYVQNEGLQQVFDNLESIGAKAICIVPRVARPTENGGKRYPDLHMDGYERTVARPVWGRHEIYLEGFLTYQPNQTLYEQSPYTPPVKPAPPGLDIEIPQKMIAEAHKRGMQAHMLLHPFILPNIRPKEQPVYIDGTVPQPPQITFNSCLNNPAAEAYGFALIKDVTQHYSELDGIFTDWAEYGAYRLEDHFTCFCPHCEQKATEWGFDWAVIKRDVNALWEWLHALTPKQLERSRRVLVNPSEILELLTHYPGWLQFLQLKNQTVTGFYVRVRELLNSNIALSARGWPPPWNRSSGMDYRALAEICVAVTPKLFTFDYSAMPRWYGQTLREWNPALSESEILDTLVEWMNVQDNFERRSFANYHIPAPSEPHPARLELYRTRLDEVFDQVDGKALCYPFAHAYLPEPQWKRMVALIRDSRMDGMWVQMYGYLSDRKLQILKEMWK